MTSLRNDAKNEITKILREQGYPTYAKLISFFDIYLTDDPEVVGYMIPDKAKIVLNEKLSINQVSTIVRHELLHEWLTHAQRKAEVEKQDEISGDSQIANIAADYEISNKGYTEADKNIARSIILGDQVLKGLVTEYDYPGWENKTFEEMYRELLKKQSEDEKSIQKILNQLSKLNKKDIDDLKDALDKVSGNQSDSSNQPNSGNQLDSGKDSDDEKKTQDSGGQTPLQKKADELSDELEEIESKLNNSGKKSSPDKGGSGENNVFDTPEEQERKANLAKNIAEIQKIFQDSGMRDAALADSKRAIDKERIAKRAAAADRVIQSPLSRFKISLDKFVKDQIEQDEVETYEIPNPSYEDEDFIEPAIVVKEEKFIPKINVYWDVSASFNDPQKTEGARKAIALLNKYVRDGDIKVDTFYFATRVSEIRSDAGGSTNGKPVQYHIEQTKPTNVIIITDGDISDCSSLTMVPGAVWILFYGSMSQNLIDHIKGKKENRQYLITDY